MIKLGVFADQSVLPQLLTQVKKIPGSTVSGVYSYGNLKGGSQLAETSGPMELMDISDAVLFLSDGKVSNDLIRMALRKSKHLYLKTTPDLQERELKELIGLEKEAGIVTYLHNPYNYLPYLKSFQQKHERPFLMTIRTSFETEDPKNSRELLLLITALSQTAESSLKKLDAIGLGEHTEQLTIDLRIEFNNGCVIHLTISKKKSPGFCEIFDSKSIARFDIKSNTPDQTSLNQELTSILSFVSQISGQDKKSNSFDNLLNGIQILNEIREHLRFDEIVI